MSRFLPASIVQRSLRWNLVPLLAFSPLALAESGLSLPPTTVSEVGEVPASGLDAPQPSASRLALSALQTPASVTRIDRQSLESRANPSVQDAVSRSPGITSIAAPGNGNTALSARGFSGHESVMTLFDGSRLYTGMGSQTFPVDTWMVEHIDVLRGPASVLYGEGATGATVNIVPKKPFEGEIRNRLRLGYGSWDQQQAALDSGGSLNQHLSYRLILNQQQSNGWVDHGNSRNTALSAALRWQATDALSFTLAHERGDSEPASYFGTPLLDGHYHDSLRDKNYNLHNAVQRNDDQWTRLNTDWQINDSLSASNQLYFITSRRHWRNAEIYTWNGAREQLLRSDYLEIKHDQEQLGDRQTFTWHHSLFGLDSQTLVGTEYNRIRFRLDNNSPYTDVGGDYINAWRPADGYFQSQSAFRPLADTLTHSVALFAENRLQLSERWSLVTGVRRDHNQLQRDNLRDASRSERNLNGGNWRAGLVFAVTDQLSLYGQYSTSEDGISNLITLSPSQQQLDLTEARQTELGLKQRFWNGDGEWTLAAFHIVKKKLLSTDPLTRLSQQVGQQSSDGLEASLELNLERGWQVSANAALLRARFDDFDDLAGGEPVSRAGNRPIDVPRRTANLWLNKDLGHQVDAGVGLRYVDARYADVANTTQVPGYTVVDASLGWQARPDVHLGVQLYNLLDRRYAVTGQNSGQQWLMGPPRSLLVTADYSF